MMDSSAPSTTPATEAVRAREVRRATVREQPHSANRVSSATNWQDGASREIRNQTAHPVTMAAFAPQGIPVRAAPVLAPRKTAHNSTVSVNSVFATRVPEIASPTTAPTGHRVTTMTPVLSPTNVRPEPAFPEQRSTATTATNVRPSRVTRPRVVSRQMSLRERHVVRQLRAWMTPH
jgi:hypothetical protein